MACVAKAKQGSLEGHINGLFATMLKTTQRIVCRKAWTDIKTSQRRSGMNDALERENGDAPCTEKDRSWHHWRQNAEPVQVSKAARASD